MKNLRSILLVIVGAVFIICGLDLALRIGMFKNYIPEPSDIDLSTLIIHRDIVHLFHQTREIFGMIFILSGCVLCIFAIPKNLKNKDNE